METCLNRVESWPCPICYNSGSKPVRCFILVRYQQWQIQDHFYLYWRVTPSPSWEEHLTTGSCSACVVIQTNGYSLSGRTLPDKFLTSYRFSGTLFRKSWIRHWSVIYPISVVRVLLDYCINYRGYVERWFGPRANTFDCWLTIITMASLSNSDA